MPRVKIEHPWYNYDRILSFNATWNMIAGGRGIGKTYGAKERVVRKHLKTGEQFIYLRRFKSELRASKDTFFADFGGEFPDQDFRVFGSVAQRAPVESRTDKKREWFTMGWFISLSNAQAQKGASFANTTTIIFDEFILEDGALHYLPNETDIFTNFYSTVDRYQDKTRVIFLANAVSIMNPYFLEYDIRPDQVPEYAKLADGFIAVHFPDSKKFKSSIYETNFGKFIKSTEYAKYAVENEFADASANLIGVKSPRASYRWSIETKLGSFAVWFDLDEREWYATSKQPRDPHTFTFIAANASREKIYVTTSDTVVSVLRTAWRQGRVTYDKPSTRNAFSELFKGR